MNDNIKVGIGFFIPSSAIIFFIASLYAENFLLSQKVKGQHYRKLEGNTQEFIDDICPSWSGALPFTGIFNQELNLLSFWQGKRDEKFFISKIDSLLGAKG